MRKEEGVETTMSGEMIIEIEGLSFKVGKRYLLDHIDWNIKKGENWVVFGLNGSGKTTLLSIIAGFGNPTIGKLKVFGQNYTADTILSVRKRIGFMSSSFFDKYYSKELALDIVLSGVNGFLGLSNKIQNSDIIKAKKLLTLLGMEHKSQQPFYELSKGERQKILIARALVSNPEILILDEPGTGLDVYAREQMLKIVRHLSGKGITIIYVTHYTEEILDLFDHCLLLKNGRIYRQGMTQELFTEENLSDFLECPVKLQWELGKFYIGVETKGM